MKPTEFDIRIIQAVRAVRELRGMKQVNVAYDLGMSECNYSKIENGYKTISLGQLETIAKTLKVSVFLILALAKSNHIVEEKVIPLSELILEFVQTAREEEKYLSDDDVNVILAKIRQAVGT